MGTWVTCPICINNLPKKYKTKKERKEVHETTCKSCKNQKARKSIETGVKRGIWLKKWDRANDAFKKAANEFSLEGQTENRLNTELMAYMAQFFGDKSQNKAKYVYEKIISGPYDEFLDKEIEIPYFVKFDPIYREAKGWNEFYKVKDISDVLSRIQQMKKTARWFFNMGYGPLFFSPYFLKEKKINVDVALNIEAEAEEFLGGYYASKDDIDNSSMHLSNAISAYMSLQNLEKARELKMIRKSLRMETACWLCGTRIRGHGYKFDYKYTYLKEDDFHIVLNQLKQRQERNPTIYDDTLYTTKDPVDTVQEHDVKKNKNLKGIYLSTCKTCQGLINQLAKENVNQFISPIWDSIRTLQTDMQNIKEQLNKIQYALSQLRR